MDLCIINFLSKFIQYNQSTKQKFVDDKFKNLIRNVLERTESKLKNGLLSIVNIGDEYKNLTRLYQVFDFDEKKIFEKKFNDLILEKYFYN